LFYEADAFPEPYRGKFLAADLLDHSAHWHELVPRGSTFQARQAGDLLRANDTWFAPTDMTLGPDGSVYISDWHDRRTAHPDPDADWDRTNGRIFALTGKGHEKTKVAAFDLGALDAEALIKLLEHPNVWFVRKARRLLAERRAAKALEQPLQAVREGLGGRKGLEILWAHYGASGIDPILARVLLDHPDAEIRLWTVRMLGDEGRVGRDFAGKLAEMATSESSAALRAQLACTAQRLPPDEGLPIAWRLLMRAENADDPLLPLLLWWAVERHVAGGGAQVLALFTSREAWNSAPVRSAIMPRLIRRYAAPGVRGGQSACALLLSACPSVEDEQLLLGSLDEALRGRRSRRFSDVLSAELVHLWKNDPGDLTRLRLAARARIPAALERATDIAFDSRAVSKARLAMLDLLGDIGDDSSRPQLLNLATRADDEAIALAALRALGHYEEGPIAEAMLEAYPRRNARWRSAARDLLLGRLEWARALLVAVNAGKIGASEVDAGQVGRVAAFGDAELDKLVRKLWGTLKGPTPEEKLAEVRRLNNDLRAAPGNAERGRALFTQHCASCHRLFGAGTEIGPDLTHANRADRDFLLVSLVDPSGTIRKEYQPLVVHLRDGRTLTGLVAGQTPDAITLVDSKNERSSIARAEIDEVKEAQASLMPEGLYKLLDPEQLRDLFSYVQSKGPGEEGIAQ
jgi:putative heme-binding domain-containing protein